MKTKTVLVQASMYKKDNNHSLKSSRQHSYEEKHKKFQKCNARHGKQDYPKTTELNVPIAPRSDVGCQNCKVDVRNEICSVRLMIFDKIKVVTCMPKI